ncbi:DUF1481 domain-containing protein [Vibrio sp. TH_r3]|uniref:DUF1481 domain-containing protein n=1 Tax=Vibrio sp. TH_r3 TaxID=3082084 RepID=UPI0029559E9A|nr:DUF1481 domain-containing protein [Vibrio sp. TH_r3]MDV7106147.1 DUF1481 domain-containing protein [Vibrio sp. TH_r3]
MMKKIILVLLASSFVIGCSSGSKETDSQRFMTFTSGQTAGDSTSFYWYTERLDMPYSAADVVTSGDYGWYQSNYRWRENSVKEIVREGTTLQTSNELVPFKVHLRFNQDGEAVYQQYRLDGKVLPFTPKQITQLKNEAMSVKISTEVGSKNGVKLIQGYWDGEQFTDCSGNEYDRIEFNQTLPSFVVNRLASLDSYAAFTGSNFVGKLVVTDLLMLDDDDHECVMRPILIEEQ